MRQSASGSNFDRREAENDFQISRVSPAGKNLEKPKHQMKYSSENTTRIFNNNRNKNENDENGRENTKNIYEAADQQFLTLDSDEDGFESLVLDFSMEDHGTESVKIAASPQSTSKIDKKLILEENAAQSNNKNHFLNKPERLSRSVSLQSTRRTQEITYLTNELAKDRPQTSLEVTEQLVTTAEKLKHINNEYKALTHENKKILGSPGPENQKYFSANVWNYLSGRKNTETPVSDLATCIEVEKLNKRILEQKRHLKEKDDKIQELLDRFGAQKRHLRQSFRKKTEVQREILEEMDEKCKSMEARANVERRLREEREAEISQTCNDFDCKEKRYQKLIEDREKQIKRVEAHLEQEVQKASRIIKEKDKELSLLKQNYNFVLENCKLQADAVNPTLKEQTVKGNKELEEIKILNLEQTLQLKTEQLDKAYVEIKNLQKEINYQRQELENALSQLEKYEIQNVVKEKLRSIKEQIIDLVDLFEQEHFSRGSKNLEDYAESQEVVKLSGEFGKRLGDKEEAD